MRGDCSEEMEKGSGMEQLFRFVVVDGLPRLIDGYEDKVAKILGGDGDEVVEYMQLVKSCEVAFVIVLLDLYLDRMIECRKNGRPFIQPGEKQGKKHGVPNMEDKEDLYTTIVNHQRYRREDPKKKTIEASDLARRRSWFKAAVDVLKQHAADKKAAAEVEGEDQDSTDGEGVSDGQQMGARKRIKKQKTNGWNVVLPNDGYVPFRNPAAFAEV